MVKRDTIYTTAIAANSAALKDIYDSLEKGKSNHLVCVILSKFTRSQVTYVLFSNFRARNSTTSNPHTEVNGSFTNIKYKRKIQLTVELNAGMLLKNPEDKWKPTDPTDRPLNLTSDLRSR